MPSFAHLAKAPGTYVAPKAGCPWRYQAGRRAPAGACAVAILRQATGLTGLPGLAHRPRRLSSSAAPPEAGLRYLLALSDGTV